MFDLTIDARVARLTLNRPEARNAIPEAGWAELTKRLEEASAARVLIVAGEGSTFSAGADFGDLALLAGDAAGAGRFRRSMRAGLDAVRLLPIPTIAAVEGGCFGAGVALAMACDIRLAGRAARFAIPPARLGITYPFEDVARLVSLVGRGQAARLLHGAMTIDATEAARIGLVEQAVENAEAAAGDLARTIAAHAPSSAAGLKTMIARAGEPGDPMLDALFDASFTGPDFAEGMAAVREKRTGDFA